MAFCNGFKRMCALLLSVLMTAGLYGCGKGEGRLAVGVGTIPAVDPFFSEGYETYIDDLIYERLLTKDGSLSSTIGECSYTENADGTVTLRFDIDEKVRFSSGRKMTADDVVFTMYLLADPGYDGDCAFCRLPIAGLSEYRNSMKIKWEMIVSDIQSVAEGGSSAYSGGYTAQEAEALDRCRGKAARLFADEIIEYCAGAYKQKGMELFGCTESELEESAGLRTALGMFAFGFCGESGDGGIVTSALGRKFDLENDFPTDEDFARELTSAYGFDIKGYDTLSAALEKSFEELFFATMESDCPGLLSFGSAGGADSITGIVREGERSLSVTMLEPDASAAAGLSIYVASLRDYSESGVFEPENGFPGFAKGDVSFAKDKTGSGSGRFAINDISDNNAVLERNKYWHGSAQTVKSLELISGDENELADALLGGDVDLIPCLSGGAAADAVKKSGSGAAVLYPSPAYGYIGLRADKVKLGDDQQSSKSRLLRSGFAVLFAYYRQEAVEEFFGDNAVLVDYPATAVSDIYPEEPEPVFSRDAYGDSIYYDSMDKEQRHEAAVRAAKSFFSAAGLLLDENGGKYVRFPKGAKKEYTFAFCGKNDGGHPAELVARLASEDLEKMGIKLNIRETKDLEELYGLLEEGKAEMWAASWEVAGEDLASVYYTSGSLNLYGLSDDNLDSLIYSARSRLDKKKRMEMYRQCYERILTDAVEVPVYEEYYCCAYNNTSVDATGFSEEISAGKPWQDAIDSIILR